MRNEITSLPIYLYGSSLFRRRAFSHPFPGRRRIERGLIARSQSVCLLGTVAWLRSTRLQPPPMTHPYRSCQGSGRHPLTYPGTPVPADSSLNPSSPPLFIHALKGHIFRYRPLKSAGPTFLRMLTSSLQFSMTHSLKLSRFKNKLRPDLYLFFRFITDWFPSDKTFKNVTSINH